MNKTDVAKLAEESIHFSKTVKRLDPALYAYVLATYPGEKVVEKMWNYLHDNLVIPTCAHCNDKPVLFHWFRTGYQEHCSIRCSQLSIKTKAKLEATNLERRGVKHNMSCTLVKTKRKETWIKTLGVDNPAKSPAIINKMQKSMISSSGTLNGFKLGVQKTYGVDNCMHIPEVAAKVLRNQMKFKPYILPSGNVLMIQGYESFVIDKLLEIYNENELLVHNAPTIWYELNGIKKAHYPDIYIPSENKIIEVKSEYTMKADFEKNIAKQNAAILEGFDYQIWIVKRMPKNQMNVYYLSNEVVKQ